MKRKVYIASMVVGILLVLAALAFSIYTLFTKQVAKYRIQGYQAGISDVYKLATRDGAIKVTNNDKTIELRLFPGDNPTTAKGQTNK